MRIPWILLMPSGMTLYIKMQGAKWEYSWAGYCSSQVFIGHIPHYYLRQASHQLQTLITRIHLTWCIWIYKDNLLQIGISNSQVSDRMCTHVECWRENRGSCLKPVLFKGWEANVLGQGPAAEPSLHLQSPWKIKSNKITWRGDFLVTNATCADSASQETSTSLTQAWVSTELHVDQYSWGSWRIGQAENSQYAVMYINRTWKENFAEGVKFS